MLTTPSSATRVTGENEHAENRDEEEKEEEEEEEEEETALVGACLLKTNATHAASSIHTASICAPCADGKPLASPSIRKMLVSPPRFSPPLPPPPPPVP